MLEFLIATATSIAWLILEIAACIAWLIFLWAALSGKFNIIWQWLINLFESAWNGLVGIVAYPRTSVIRAMAESHRQEFDILTKAVATSGITIGAKHQEIEPYQPQAQQEEMQFAPPDWSR